MKCQYEIRNWGGRFLHLQVAARSDREVPEHVKNERKCLVVKSNVRRTGSRADISATAMAMTTAVHALPPTAKRIEAAKQSDERCHNV
jgi:hypothetical protein